MTTKGRKMRKANELNSKDVQITFRKNIYFAWMFADKLKYSLLTIVVLLSGFAAKAQVMDSLKYHFNQPAHLFGGFNNRTSLVNGNNAKILGLQGGLIFDEKIKIFMSYSWMATPTTERKIRNAHTAFADTFIHRQSMNFMSVGTEYVFRQTEKWKFSVPVHFGVGTTNLKKLDTDGVILSEDRALVFPLEVGVNATYFITDWLTVNGGLGNRFTATSLQESQLSGPYYKLGIGILFGVIYKKVSTDWHGSQ